MASLFHRIMRIDFVVPLMIVLLSSILCLMSVVTWRNDSSQPATTIFVNQSAVGTVKVTIADIQSGHVMIVGRLGVPLGTAVLVTGSWQREQSLSAVPRNAPRLQLLVYSVDGRKLDEPLLFPDVVRCDLYGLDDKQRMSNEANSLPQEFRVFERIDYTGAPAKIYPSEEPPGDFPGFAAVGSICVHLAILPSEDEETGEESVPL